jgi:hypothetical protein
MFFSFPFLPPKFLISLNKSERESPPPPPDSAGVAFDCDSPLSVTAGGGGGGGGGGGPPNDGGGGGGGGGAAEPNGGGGGGGGGGAAEPNGGGGGGGGSGGEIDEPLIGADDDDDVIVLALEVISAGKSVLLISGSMLDKSSVIKFDGAIDVNSCEYEMSAIPMRSGKNVGTLKSGTAPNFGLKPISSRLTASSCSPLVILYNLQVIY